MQKFRKILLYLFYVYLGPMPIPPHLYRCIFEKLYVFRTLAARDPSEAEIFCQIAHLNE